MMLAKFLNRTGQALVPVAKPIPAAKLVPEIETKAVPPTRSILVFESPPGGAIDPAGALQSSEPYSAADDGLFLEADSTQPTGLKWGAASPPPPTPVESQEVYVNKGGNDSTGDGSYAKPFLTIQRAMTSITDNSQTKVYGVNVGPGTYNDNFAFKPWVSVVGFVSSSGFEGVTQIGAGAVISFDPSWIGATYNVAWFSHLTFNNMPTFNILTQAGEGAQLTFFDCLFNSGVSFIGGFSGNVNNMTLDDCLSYGPVSIQDCSYLFFIGGAATFGGLITATATSAAGPASSTKILALGGSTNAVTLTSNAGGGGATASMQGFTVTNTLTLNGAQSVYQSTVAGIPGTIVRSGGAPMPTTFSQTTNSANSTTQPFAAPVPSGTVEFARKGVLVMMTWPAPTFAAATAATSWTYAGFVPTNWTPAATTVATIYAENNGVFAAGTCQVDTAGNVAFAPSGVAPGGNWAGAGTTGFYTFSTVWSTV